MNCRYEVWAEHLDGESVFPPQAILSGPGVRVPSSGHAMGGEGWSHGRSQRDRALSEGAGAVPNLVHGAKLYCKLCHRTIFSLTLTLKIRGLVGVISFSCHSYDIIRIVALIYFTREGNSVTKFALEGWSWICRLLKTRFATDTCLKWR